MRARIRGGDLYFDIDGPGFVASGSSMRERRAAFLVHGGPGLDHSGMRAIYGPLRDRLQLVYFDHRGQGRSDRCDPSRYNLDENVEDMEALRDYLGLDKIVSIGTSYGGKVAMAHAARYPDSVSHLILVVTVAHSGYVERSRQIVAKRGTAEQVAMCDDLYSGRIRDAEHMRRYLEVMGPLYGRSYDPVQASEALSRCILSPEALTRAHGPDGFLRAFDLRPELKAITAPTLIVAGRHDWICPPEFSTEIQSLIRGSDLRIFKNSGHSVGSDEPEALRDAIAGFIIYRSGHAEPANACAAEGDRCADTI